MKAKIRQNRLVLLKPCPFCGNQDVYTKLSFGVDAFMCDYCGAVVSFRIEGNREESIKLWNTRGEKQA